MTWCTAYSHCISSAYDAATDLCYLHSNTSQGSESPLGLLVYKDKGETEKGGGRGGDAERERERE